jgi:tRNA U34 2-thiouridine synthase MnmA/TrmU
MSKQVKGLVLLSGGLDSTLAMKLVHNIGVDVEAAHFTTPFCNCDKCSVERFSKEFGIRIHHVFLGQEFLDLLVDPPHGYGSQMNICIDCRILMFQKAEELAEEIGAAYFITGEVLDQRPFSQKMHIMKLIEKEAGVQGRVLRPLSAKLLPETEVEKKGVIDREALHSLRGRRRLPQMRLADELGIRDYPCPSGGCLLTDPNFANRLRDYMANEGELRLEDIALLRLGRHFRIGATRIIVGRNEEENRVLLSIAENKGTPFMSVIEYVGPVTLIIGLAEEEEIDKSASITVRYSDAPGNAPVEVKYRNGKITTLVAKAIDDEQLEKWRI